MHLLIMVIGILGGLAVVTRLVARYPVNRTLRWKNNNVGPAKTEADAGSIHLSSSPLRRAMRHPPCL